MSEFEDDLSASTARFQAFAERKDQELPAPWHMRASGSKVGLMAGIVIAVAILVAIVASLIAG
jgi:hypothetical protein